MICQACGNNPAVVHLEELRDGERVHLWLCVECAEKQKSCNEEFMDGVADFQIGDGLGFRADSSFASFLGHISENEKQVDGTLNHCPTCGYTLDQLARTSRLGCAGCYAFFRRSLLPVLARLHRHSSHLGKVPRRGGDGLSNEGEIARYRVALEKAIVAENFEDAARLRDLIVRLEGLAVPEAELPEDSSSDSSAESAPFNDEEQQ